MDTLNDAQKEAVMTTEGPLLVLAGAGAGKTRVIAHRILRIVQQGIDPREILAITFTNKAAAEMRERIHALLLKEQGIAETPFVSTFHSLGLLMIKEHARLLGFPRRPSIYDRNDSLRAVKEALKEVGALEEMEPRAVLGRISRQKGEGISVEQFAEHTEHSYDHTTATVWRRYADTLRKEVAVDFDDLLYYAVRLLEEHPSVRSAYQHRWRYIHVDEYQDTNSVQARLMQLLVGKEHHICVVGDVDQTIYSWRGAQIKNLLAFEQTFPHTKMVMLEENYRSTQTILAAANEVIAKNTFRPEKNLYTRNGVGECITLYQAVTETDEARFVAETIATLIKEGKAPNMCAVLYRANFQSRALEEALLQRRIPYQVLGTRFFERKEVKDVLSYIRASLGGTSQDLIRIANTPARGIGKVTLMKLLSGKEDTLPLRTKTTIAQLRTLLAHIGDATKTLTPSQLVRFVCTHTGLEMLYKKDLIEGQERLENIRELVSLAARYDHYPPQEGLELFLDAAALASDQDELKEETNAVRLMTVHAAKGLEFPYVFITGLEEGLFPYEKEGERPDDKEEERRLMYVALTRAQKQVFLSYAAYRTVFGTMLATEPSQFLSDIPEALLYYQQPNKNNEEDIYID